MVTCVVFCFFFFTRPHRLTIFSSQVLIVAWLVHICLHLVQRFLEKKKDNIHQMKHIDLLLTRRKGSIAAAHTTC